MALTALQNQVYSQALRGQNVKITLSGSDAITYLPQLSVGMECIDDSTGSSVGFIYSVDYYGNSFEICPIQPNKSFQSPDTPGYFPANYDVAVNI